MASIEGNFSKIVRSLLLDIDTYLDQLVQIGYYTAEQRAFLDKFLYKSEDALLAADLARGSRDGHSIDNLFPKLTSWQENSTRSLTPILSKLEHRVDDRASRVLPRFKSVTDTLKAEENGLTNFLKRCNARNFSVQVKSPEGVREFTNNDKVPDFISTLEPIAEGALKASEGVGTRLDDSKSSASITQDTEMMQFGIATLTCDMDAESIDYGETIAVDVAPRISLDETKPASNNGTDNIESPNIKIVNIKIASAKPANVKAFNIEAVSLEPTKVETSNSSNDKAASPEPTKVGNVNIKVANLKPTNVEPINAAPTAIELPMVTSAKVEATQNEINNSEPTGASLVSNLDQTQNDIKADRSPALPAAVLQNTKKVKLNAWGKPIKADPTRNEEGAVVGGAAKPLGPENKGRAMMEKMGWSKGTGLGKQKNGILEPIPLKVKNTKIGLHSLDEKKHKLDTSSSSSENTPNSTSVEAKTSDWDATDMTAANNNGWDKPAEVTAEQIRDAAVWADAEKVRQAEVAKAALKPRAEYHGIKAMFLREGEGSAEKTIKFKTRFLSTNEYKSTRHYPGVVVKALSPQSSDYSKRPDDTGFKVSPGNHLEILRLKSGNDYHVYNFQKKRRGIVKISFVEMMEESEADLDDGHSVTSYTAAAAAASALP